jgi:serine/threonine protein kinase
MSHAKSKFSPGSPDAPTPFGSYSLVGMVAKGGMAEVYRAVHPEARRMIAIKCMRTRLAREQRFVDMFIREGRLALLLEHEHIVRALEIGRHEGRYFITMEYLSGRDLTQVLRRCQQTGKRIPLPHALYIASCVSRGLHYAHQRTDEQGNLLNLVNRDVSPSNVRLGYDGGVWLLDFGIAQGMMKYTSEIGILKGKFSYMSPEQIRGMRVDSRTDIFSTGIFFNDTATTEKLFRGDSEFDLMENVRSVDIAPPSRFNRRVKPGVDAVVLRALAREPEDRFQSAADFADALDAQLADYDFRPQELQSYLRQLFAVEYERERAALSAALERVLGPAVPPAAVASRTPTPAPTRPAPAPPPPAPSEEPLPPAPVDLTPPAPTPAPAPDEHRLLIWLLLGAAVAIACAALIILHLG